MTSTRPFIVGLSLFLAACSGVPQATGPLDAAAACTAAFEHLDAAVESAAVGDAEAARIEGFPYLRVNRFLASFRFVELDDAAQDAWVDRLRQLDRAARQVELANLPAGQRRQVEERLAVVMGRPFSFAADLDACADLLRLRDLAGNGAAWLRRAARAPDSYNTALRLAGFYPVTSIGVAVGFARWKQAFLRSFGKEPARGDAEGTLDLYHPTVLQPNGQRRSVRRLRAHEVAEIIAAAADNPLGIPAPRGRALEQLVETFSPHWQVRRASTADLIGQPTWGAEDQAARINVDSARPVAFTRLSHTRFGGDILPQINYMVWFKERPRTGPLDLLGGDLDAVIWRVTIGRDGRPWFYDTIHACGCYHLFFPVPPRQRQPTPEDKDLREEVLVPAEGPQIADGGSLTVHLASGSHYVTGLSPERESGPGSMGEADAVGLQYRLLPPGEVPDFALRAAALPASLGGGSRSIYAPDGLVPGSERLERLILWPMGIASAGAMRQWGHHATAFVGRRHFDDPDLFAGAFRP